jgi:hypothetical protein
MPKVNLAGCVIYVPYWSPAMASSPFRALGSSQLICTRTGGVWSFQGITTDGDDYTSVGAVSSFNFIKNTGIFTILTWMKLASPTDDDIFTICSSSSGASTKGFLFAYDNRAAQSSDNLLRIDIFDGDGVAIISSKSNANIITDTNWHFVCVRGDATNVFFTVDTTTQTGSSSMTAKTTGNDTNVMLIDAANGASIVGYNKGTRGDFAVYSRCLTVAEVENFRTVTKWRY